MCVRVGKWTLGWAVCTLETFMDFYKNARINMLIMHDFYQKNKYLLDNRALLCYNNNVEVGAFYRMTDGKRHVLFVFHSARGFALG